VTGITPVAPKITYWSCVAGAAKMCTLLQFEITSRQSINQIISGRIAKCTDNGTGPLGPAGKNVATTTNINHLDEGDTSFNGNVYWGPWGTTDPTELEYVWANYQQGSGGWVYNGPPIRIPPAGILVWKFANVPATFDGNFLAVIGEEL
jgi:hypothetical protein